MLRYRIPNSNSFGDFFFFCKLLTSIILFSGVNSDPTSTWAARMPSDRDVMRAIDLIGGFKPYQGTLPDYKIVSKFIAPESYGKFWGDAYLFAEHSCRMVSDTIYSRIYNNRCASSLSTLRFNFLYSRSVRVWVVLCLRCNRSI